MQLKRILSVLLAVSLLAPAAAAYATPEQRTPTTAPDTAPNSLVGTNESDEYVRLYIDDDYRHVELKPGQSESFSITVENGDDHPVDVSPHVFVPKMGSQRPVKPDWVSIDPSDVTLDPGEERTFDVTVDVPEDAELARYRGTIAFTNETVSYENRPPRPVHAAGFALTVFKEPLVRITQGNYLSARVQAGDTVTRTITIENTGDQAVPLNPQLDIGSSRHYHSPGNDQELQRSWIRIDAPAQVPAGESVDVQVTIDVPEQAATGDYDTEFSLGLKDPHRRDDRGYWQRIGLSLQVWEQPDRPFETTVAVREDTETMSITVEANRYYRHQQRSSMERPTFDVVFVAPNGTVVTPEKVTRTQSGGVNLAEDRQGGADDGPYMTGGERYEVTYRISKPQSGEWTVRIMPHNVMHFGYEITQESSSE
ncbi:MAG: hypothetical protein ACI9YT_000150 [Halobacteriales archaeon]|jgi:hypothetical protein